MLDLLEDVPDGRLQLLTERLCPKCGRPMAFAEGDRLLGREWWECERGVSVSIPTGEPQGEQPRPWRFSEVGQRNCATRCGLFGTESCERCPVPNRRGAPTCPHCGGRLYFIELVGDRVRWGCQETDCPVLSFPLDPVAAATADEAQRRHWERLDAETEREERWLRAERRRAQRQRRKAKALAPAG